MTRKNPVPTGYCSVLHGGGLHPEPLMLLPRYQGQHQLASIVRTCLCNSCGWAEIRCDPNICSAKLAQSMDFVVAADNPQAALGGTAKKIFREYNAERIKTEGKTSAEFTHMMQSILGDDY